MFRIGDFSRIARVSARMLRFYDEIGLLKPARADPESGYRFYSVVQLERLNRITVLKDLGFGLDQIGVILDRRLAPAELRAMLEVRRSDAERTLQHEQQRLRHIETRIAQIEAEGTLPLDDVVVRAEPARRLLSLRRTVASFAEGRGLIRALHEQSRSLLPRGHGCPLLAIAHSPQFEADEIDLEVGFDIGELTPALPADSVLTANVLPAVERMAVCVRVGLPEHAHRVTARIGAFLEAAGEVFDGPGRELFLHLPPHERMDEAVVEMQFPVQSAGAAGRR